MEKWLIRVDELQVLGECGHVLHMEVGLHQAAVIIFMGREN